MEKKPETIEQPPLEVPQNKIPFLVKAVSLLLIVYGFIGFGYYFFATIYSIGNPDFLKNLDYSGIKGSHLFVPLAIEVIIHLLLIIAGFMLFRGKKRGTYYFYPGYIIAIGYTTFFLGSFSIIETGIGLLVATILIIYNKRLR